MSYLASYDQIKFSDASAALVILRQDSQIRIYRLAWYESSCRQPIATEKNETDPNPSFQNCNLRRIFLQEAKRKGGKTSEPFDVNMYPAGFDTGRAWSSSNPRWPWSSHVSPFWPLIYLLWSCPTASLETGSFVLHIEFFGALIISHSVDHCVICSESIQYLDLKLEASNDMLISWLRFLTFSHGFTLVTEIFRCGQARRLRSLLIDAKLLHNFCDECEDAASLFWSLLINFCAASFLPPSNWSFGLRMYIQSDTVHVGLIISRHWSLNDLAQHCSD